MHLEHYQYRTNEQSIDYEFESIGLNFFTTYPNADVFIKGTSEVRTRRYQMGISKYIGEISLSIEVLGYYEGEWIPFKKGINFQAFVGRKL